MQSENEQSLSESEKAIPPPSWKDQGYLPMRYVVTIMGAMAGFMIFQTRLNIHFGIVAMVKPIENIYNSTNSTDDDHCGFPDLNEKEKEEYAGDFEWDEWAQGIVLASFYWGYTLAHFPGGRLADILGARLIMGLSMLGSGIFSLLTPVAAHTNFGLLVAVRFALGLCQGCFFPGCHVMSSQWFPPLELSWMMACRSTGNWIGIVAVFPISAFLISTFGWETIFYVPGTVSIIWAVCWFLVYSERPGNNQWISKVEKDFIEQSIGDRRNHKLLRLPIKSILTSVRVWAVIIAGIGDGWGFYTLMSNLPMYMKNVLKLDINSNGLMASLPYLGFIMFCLMAGNVGDRLRKKGVISTTTLRKCANTSSHLVAAIALFSLSLVECDRDITFALFIIAVTFQGLAYSGYNVNVIDIAPNYTGFIYGFGNGLANVSGFIVPMMVGAIVTDQKSIPQWRTVFNIGGVVYIADVIFYLIFASGEEQSWNRKYDYSQCENNDDEEDE